MSTTSSTTSTSSSSSSTFGVCIALTFMTIELAKVALERAYDTRAIDDLQRDVVERRRSLARELASANATTSATTTTDSAFASSSSDAVRRRMDVLDAKIAELERKRTPSARFALECAHWLSATKACAGAWACVSRGAAPVFTLPRALVWPLGAWLSFPYGMETEPGVVAVVPWTLVSAVGSERVARGVVEPVLGFCLEFVARRRRARKGRPRAAKEA